MSDQNLSIGDKFAAANEQALSEWTSDGDDAVVETAAEEAPEVRISPLLFTLTAPPWSVPELR